jgi:glutamine synthetase
METALAPSNGIRGVDDSIYLKLLIKKVASERGLLATFMARWNDSVDGQGGHIHMSLETQKGESLFSMNGPGREKFDQFIGGLQECASDNMVMFAPNCNSYRRFQPGIFAPVDTSWAWDGRKQTFRAIGPQAQRVENRLPGADCNPYHAVAATAAAGIWGIENGVQPSPNGASLNDESLPSTLEKAAIAFRQSERAKHLFGEKFVEMISLSKIALYDFLHRPVTDIERQYLLELA